MNPQHMERAIELSRHAVSSRMGGPFGAVIVRDDIVIAEGFNRVLSSFDPTAHAEVEAIRAASKVLQSPHLEGCEIYTSCEPCPMCLAAMYWAGLERMYYGNSKRDADSAGFQDADLYAEFLLPAEERRIPGRQLLGAEARAVIEEWKRDPSSRLY